MSTKAIQTSTTCDHSFILEGSVTSASSNTLVDSTKDWPTDIWRGRTVRIWSGKGDGQEILVDSNTGNTLFLNTNWTTVPDTTSLYRGVVYWKKEYCPKCLGSGKYSDWTFKGGKSKVLSGIFKLAQDIETVVLTPRGSSIFTPKLGSGVELVFGSDIVDDEELKGMIESNVMDSLSFFINSQNSAFNILDFDESELFGQLRELFVARRSTREDADKVGASIDPTILDLYLNVVSFDRQEVPVTSPLNIK